MSDGKLLVLSRAEQKKVNNNPQWREMTVNRNDMSTMYSTEMVKTSCEELNSIMVDNTSHTSRGCGYDNSIQRFVKIIW